MKAYYLLSKFTFQYTNSGKKVELAVKQIINGEQVSCSLSYVVLFLITSKFLTVALLAVLVLATNSFLDNCCTRNFIFFAEFIRLAFFMSLRDNKCSHSSANFRLDRTAKLKKNLEKPFLSIFFLKEFFKAYYWYNVREIE